MLQWMDRLFEQFGKTAMLYTTAGRSPVSVIFQSINSRSWQNTDHRHSPLGQIPRGQYICMLPAGTAASAGDRLQVDESSYEIRRLEKMRMGSQTVYLWGLCVEREG